MGLCNATPQKATLAQQRLSQGVLRPIPAATKKQSTSFFASTPTLPTSTIPTASQGGSFSLVLGSVPTPAKTVGSRPVPKPAIRPQPTSRGTFTAGRLSTPAALPSIAAPTLGTTRLAALPAASLGGLRNQNNKRHVPEIVASPARRENLPARVSNNLADVRKNDGNGAQKKLDVPGDLRAFGKQNLERLAEFLGDALDLAGNSHLEANVGSRWDDDMPPRTLQARREDRFKTASRDLRSLSEKNTTEFVGIPNDNIVTSVVNNVMAPVFAGATRFYGHTQGQHKQADTAAATQMARLRTSADPVSIYARNAVSNPASKMAGLYWAGYGGVLGSRFGPLGGLLGALGGGAGGYTLVKPVDDAYNRVVLGDEGYAQYQAMLSEDINRGFIAAKQGDYLPMFFSTLPAWLGQATVPGGTSVKALPAVRAGIAAMRNPSAVPQMAKTAVQTAVAPFTKEGARQIAGKAAATVYDEAAAAGRPAAEVAQAAQRASRVAVNQARAVPVAHAATVAVPAIQEIKRELDEYGFVDPIAVIGNTLSNLAVTPNKRGIRIVEAGGAHAMPLAEQVGQTAQRAGMHFQNGFRRDTPALPAPKPARVSAAALEHVDVKTLPLDTEADLQAAQHHLSRLQLAEIHARGRAEKAHGPGAQAAHARANKLNTKVATLQQRIGNRTATAEPTRTPAASEPAPAPSAEAAPGAKPGNPDTTPNTKPRFTTSVADVEAVRLDTEDGMQSARGFLTELEKAVKTAHSEGEYQGLPGKAHAEHLGNAASTLRKRIQDQESYNRYKAWQAEQAEPHGATNKSLQSDSFMPGVFARAARGTRSTATTTAASTPAAQTAGHQGIVPAGQGAVAGAPPPSRAPARDSSAPPTPPTPTHANGSGQGGTASNPATQPRTVQVGRVGTLAKPGKVSTHVLTPEQAHLWDETNAQFSQAERAVQSLQWQQHNPANNRTSGRTRDRQATNTTAVLATLARDLRLLQAQQAARQQQIVQASTPQQLHALRQAWGLNAATRNGSNGIAGKRNTSIANVPNVSNALLSVGDTVGAVGRGTSVPSATVPLSQKRTTPTSIPALVRIEPGAARSSPEVKTISYRTELPSEIQHTIAERDEIPAALRRVETTAIRLPTDRDVSLRSEKTTPTPLRAEQVARSVPAARSTDTHKEMRRKVIQVHSAFDEQIAHAQKRHDTYKKDVEKAQASKNRLQLSEARIKLGAENLALEALRAEKIRRLLPYYRASEPSKLTPDIPNLMGSDVKAAMQQACYVLGQMLEKSALSRNPSFVDGIANISIVEATGRSGFDPVTKQIRLALDATFDEVLHELGHWLEDTIPGAHQRAVDFYNLRTAKDILEPVLKYYPESDAQPNEMLKKDKFVEPYIGRDYKNRNSTEVFSVGLDRLFSDQALAEKDPTHFELILRTLKGM